jgi:hypothetical protein
MASRIPQDTPYVELRQYKLSLQATVLWVADPLRAAALDWAESKVGCRLAVERHQARLPSVVSQSSEHIGNSDLHLYHIHYCYISTNILHLFVHSA